MVATATTLHARVRCCRKRCSRVLHNCNGEVGNYSQELVIGMDQTEKSGWMAAEREKGGMQQWGLDQAMRG